MHPPPHRDLDLDLDLHAQALTPAAFAPYGQVLAWPASGGPTAPAETVNAGTAQRLPLLADAQLAAEGGRPVVALYRAQAQALPLRLRLMERHRHGSQSFAPLGTAVRMLVVVADPRLAAPTAADLRAFVSDGRQGVWLAPGTWHHPLLALDAGDLLVLERRADAVDCDERPLDPAVWVVPPAGGPSGPGSR